MQHTRTALRLSLLLLGSSALAITPLGDWATGIATNYGGAADGMNPYSPSFGTEDGSCGYGAISQQAWPYWSVGAVSTSNPLYQAPGQGCGACIEITCMNEGGEYAGRCNSDGQSIIIQITDSCPQCESDHFDIQALTYSKISPQTTGRIDIQYRRVQCVPPSSMDIMVDNNNGPSGWLRLYVTSAGGVGAISQVQARTTGTTSWTTMNNDFGSVFELPNAPAYPLDLNVVGTDGESVSAYGLITASGQVGQVPAGVQFSIADPSATALTIPTTPTTTPSPPAPVTVTASPVTTIAATNSTPTAPAATVSTQSINTTVPASPAATSTCVDTPVPGAFTCAQQAAYGQCGQTWMAGFCEITCGKCTAPASPSPVSPSPASPAASTSPSPGAVTVQSTPASPAPTCVDVPAPGAYTCAQQASWSQCSQSWMTAGNFCAATCGRCSSRRLRL